MQAAILNFITQLLRELTLCCLIKLHLGYFQKIILKIFEDTSGSKSENEGTNSKPKRNKIIRSNLAVNESLMPVHHT